MQATRRTALMGLALAGSLPLALASTRVFAQDSQESSQPSAQESAPEDANQGGGTPAESSGAADYVAQTLAIGTLSLQSSQLAAETATNPLVKEFATLEAAEQTTVAQVLSATEAGKEPPAMPPEDSEKLNTLQTTEAGDAFDRAYIQMQIEGHQRLLEVQRTLSGGNEPTVEVITAKLAEQAITSHLAMLNHINQQLGA